MLSLITAAPISYPERSGFAPVLSILRRKIFFILRSIPAMLLFQPDRVSINASRISSFHQSIPMLAFGSGTGVSIDNSKNSFIEWSNSVHFDLLQIHIR
jgi:hypothetical protein